MSTASFDLVEPVVPATDPDQPIMDDFPPVPQLGPRIVEEDYSSSDDDDDDVNNNQDDKDEEDRYAENMMNDAAELELYPEGQHRDKENLPTQIKHKGRKMNRKNKRPMSCGRKQLYFYCYEGGCKMTVILTPIDEAKQEFTLVEGKDKKHTCSCTQIKRRQGKTVKLIDARAEMKAEFKRRAVTTNKTAEELAEEVYNLYTKEIYGKDGT